MEFPAEGWYRGWNGCRALYGKIIQRPAEGEVGTTIEAKKKEKRNKKARKNFSEKVGYRRKWSRNCGICTYVCNLPNFKLVGILWTDSFLRVYFSEVLNTAREFPQCEHRTSK